MIHLLHRLLVVTWKVALPIWLPLLVLAALGIEFTPGDGGRVAAIWGLTFLGIGAIAHRIEHSLSGCVRHLASTSET
jgi:hypothetical protein